MKTQYYLIKEPELLRLVTRDILLEHLECAGVDNWDSGGVITELFNEDCKEAGLPEMENGEHYDYDYSYEDLARIEIKNRCYIKEG